VFERAAIGCWCCSAPALAGYAAVVGLLRSAAKQEMAGHCVDAARDACSIWGLVSDAVRAIGSVHVPYWRGFGGGSWRRLLVGAS